MKTINKASVIFSILLIVHLATPFFLVRTNAVPNRALDYAGNKCLSFDGNSSYVRFGYGYNPQSVTIEAWVNPAYDIVPSSNSLYGHRWGTIAHSDTAAGGGNEYGWWFGFDYLMGTLYFGFYHNYYTYVEFNTNHAFWNSSWWYYVAVTYDPNLSTDSMKFYINGTLDSSHTVTQFMSTPIYYGNVPLEIGAEGIASDANDRFPYRGLIDEFRLWNVSRTQTEIQSAWNRLLNVTETTDPRLLGYWSLDDGTGKYAQDSSSYNHVGTLLPDSSPPQWNPIGAPITPEFSAPLLMFVLISAGLLVAIVFRKQSALEKNRMN